MTQTAQVDIDRAAALAYRAAGKVVVAIALGYDVETVAPLEEWESLVREPSRYPGLVQAAASGNDAAGNCLVLLIAGPLAEQRHIGKREPLSVQSLGDRSYADDLARIFAGNIFRDSLRTPAETQKSFAQTFTGGNIPRARFALGSSKSIASSILRRADLLTARLIATTEAWRAIERVVALLLANELVTGNDIRGMLSSTE